MVYYFMVPDTDRMHRLHRIHIKIKSTFNLEEVLSALTYSWGQLASWGRLLFLPLAAGEA